VRVHSLKRLDPPAALLVTAVSILLVGVAPCVEQTAQGASQIIRFDPDRLAIASVDFSAHRYDEARARQVLNAILDAARRLPGAESAALSSGLPTRSSAANTTAATPDTPASAMASGNHLELVASTPDIFRTLTVVILAGRAFTESDTERSPRVAIISEAVAAALFPDLNPIGHEIVVRYGGSRGAQRAADTCLIVGVASDTEAGGERGSGAVYLPFTQHYEPHMSVVVRADRPADLLPALRAAIARVDPELALTELGTGRTIIDRSFVMPK
jgi:hypothetical protein